MSRPQRSDAIAIVGAGPAGLFAARALARLGYRDVCLFEATRTVAASTRTARVDGYAFDFSTKFVPAVSLHGTEVYPPLRALIAETGSSLIESEDATFYHPVARERVDRPDVLEGFSKLRILTDFVEAFRLLAEIELVEGLGGLVKSGLARADETIEAWGKRHKVASFAAFGAYLSDVFSGGPSMADHAGYLLKSRIHFLGGYLQSMFQQSRLLGPAIRVYDGLLDIFDGPDSEGAAEIAEILKSPASRINNYVLQDGYQPFLAKVAAMSNLEIHFNSPVRGIERVDGQVELRFDAAAPQRFDRVLVTCPPDAVAGMFGEGRPERRLFSGHARDHRILSWLFEAEGWPSDAVGESGVLLDASNPIGLGRHDLTVDARIYGMSKEYADSDVLVAPVYLPEGMSVDQAEGVLRTEVARYGMTMKRVIQAETFRYPRTISLSAIADGWFETVEAMQGDGGVYFLGEAFAGQGVPTALDFVEKFVPRFFG